MNDPWGNDAPKLHLIYCVHCDTTVNGVQAGQVEEFVHPSEGVPIRTTLVRCPDCDRPSLFSQEEWSGIGWDEMFRLWPAQARSLDHAVPEQLRKEHQDARKCLDAKAYTATVVMVRRVLEGVCALHGVSTPSLSKSLKVMKQRELIDAQLLEWAEELRGLGNDGAHYSKADIDRQDALDSLALCEAMLDYLYVLTAKFHEFKARRNTRPTQADAQTME